MIYYTFQQVESASFTLEALICPAGYVLRPHATLTGISVCTCNEEIRDIVLCEDDQETVVIKVCVEGGREGVREGGRGGGGEGGRGGGGEGGRKETGRNDYVQVY